MNADPLRLEPYEKQRRRRWRFLHRFVITGQDGTPYLIRWTLIGTPFGAVMLHKFLRSDADACLHDHPWPFVSFVLCGGYGEDVDSGILHHHAPAVLYRPAEWRHRVILYRDGQGREMPAWTLVFRGPRRREWGFWTKGGWMQWRRFLDSKARGVALCEEEA